jgi:DNA-binding transcriptional LysR family regulator
MMDTLMSLRVFAAVSELKSFTAAASRLSISAAMASKHILHLETELATRLLNRTSRSVSLTESGALYLEQVRQALDGLDEARATIGQTTADPRGILKMSAPVWMANPQFAKILSEYAARYPDVQLDVDLSARQVNVVEEGFDLALRVTASTHPGLIARVVSPIEFALVAAPRYIERAGAPKSLDDLDDRDFLAFATLPSDGRLTWDWPHGRKTLHLRPVLRSSNESLLHLAALQGMGLALLPEWVVTDDVRAARLVRLLPGEAVVKGKMFAVYPSRKFLSAKVRTFIDFLTSHPLTTDGLAWGEPLNS